VNPPSPAAVLLVLVALAEGDHLAAQTITGTVYDDATSAPLPGAFVEVADVHGSRVAAALSDSAGRFHFDVVIGRSTLRGEAVGYEDVATSVELAPGEERALDLRMRPFRLVLPGPGAEVPGACPSPRDTTDPVAAALREARKSLRLADWSMREAGLALVTRRYVRTSGASPQLNPDAVWVDTVYGQLPYSPAALVPEGGGKRPLRKTATIQPPGIDALLSDAFVRAHCFSFRRKEGRIGLAFSPVHPGPEAGIRGTFWLEPDGAVRQIDFTLASVTRTIRHPGGSVELARTPEGYTIVRRWIIRVAISGMVTEAGGEVIRSWMDEP
jgi:hypothetical protein